MTKRRTVKLTVEEMIDDGWMSDIYDTRRKDNRKDAVKFYKGQICNSNTFGEVEVLGFVERRNQEVVVIKFLNTGNVRLIRPCELKRGQFGDIEYLTKVKGRTVMTNTCGECEILTNPDSSKASRTYRVDVRFKDSGGVVPQVLLSHLLAGRCKDPWRPVCSGVGYVGLGKYSSMESSRKKSLVYDYWSDMLKRCYGKKFENTSYREFGVTVDERWHNFQNFAQWFDEQPFKERSWQIDKDFINPGNTIYSPENCAIVPREINGFYNFDHRKVGYMRQGINKSNGGTYIVSVGQGSSTRSKTWPGFKTAEEAFQKYKLEKEKKAKELAEYWEGRVDSRVIHALRNLDIQPQFPE